MARWIAVDCGAERLGSHSWSSLTAFVRHSGTTLIKGGIQSVFRGGLAAGSRVIAAAWHGPALVGHSAPMKCRDSRQESQLIPVHACTAKRERRNGRERAKREGFLRYFCAGFCIARAVVPCAVVPCALFFLVREVPQPKVYIWCLLTTDEYIKHKHNKSSEVTQFTCMEEALVLHKSLSRALVRPRGRAWCGSRSQNSPPKGSCHTAQDE